MANETVVLDLNPNAFASAVVEENSNDPLNDTRDPRENRLCPLCNSEIRLFFINFNEKFLMCANTECEFPFGHEELTFVKEDEDLASDFEDIGMKTRTTRSSSIAESTVSGAAWSEIDRLNRAYELEDSLPEGHSRRHTAQEKKKKENEDKILKNIEDIKELNEELVEVNAPHYDKRQLKNTKWIKTLKNLEAISGFQLLKPEEIGLLRKEEPAIGLGELKIDIDPGNSASMSSIKIEIHNSSNDATEEPLEKVEPVYIVIETEEDQENAVDQPV